MKLFKHQQDLLDRNPDRHALIWETGTGKTHAAIALAYKKTDSVLIICPKGLVEKWKKDIEPYFNTENNYCRVISKEQFKKYHKELKYYECVIVDEAHYFFGTTSALMKSLKWYLNHQEIQYRYFLTATPYRSTPMDVYIMCDLLGHKLNYWTFQTKFFYQVRMGMRMVPMVRKGIEKDIAAIVQSVGSIVKLAECIDMPESMFKEVYLELTPAQNEAIKNLDDVSPIVRYTKIHQICGGTLKGDEYTESQLFDSHKLDDLIGLIPNIDRLIVVCRYNHEIETLQSVLSGLNRRVEMINGSVTGEDRHRILSELEQEEKYVLLVNSAVSEGWQLQNCSHMVFYSYDFQLKNYIQMIGRLRRIDRPRPVLYISLIVKDTIDEAVFKSVQRKEDFHLAIYAKDHSVV